jgi:mono/diheme cytochrome c family protein
MLINFFLINGFTIFLFACSGSSQNSNQETVEIQSAENKTEVSPNKQGENLYLKYCMACHQVDGSGAPGMYPPLINSPIVNSGNKKDFINVLLNGLKGPIEVHGKTYNQQMPKQDFLTDEELSLIINYVSSSFENKGSKITPADIKAQRNSSSK